MTITPKQYAASKGISLSAVTKKIRDKKPLDGVLYIQNMGRFYILHVENNFKIVQ